MVQSIGDAKLKARVQAGHFEDLFLDELLWDNPDGLRSTRISLPNRDDDFQSTSWTLEPVCQKRGVAVFTCDGGDVLPDKATRVRIARQLEKTAHEHLIIFHTTGYHQQVWYWPNREPGKPARPREIGFNSGENAARLLNLLKEITFDFASEGTLVLTDVTSALNRAASADKVTKKFYDEFSKQRAGFVDFIKGIPVESDRGWYAAIMLNRLMFTWFLQARGFLDNDRNYLANRLEAIERGQIPGASFHQFYKDFLRTLFHEGFGGSERSSKLRNLIGEVPYINGGIFDRHHIEITNPDIDIPNDAFRKLFGFFGQYTWHLDDRPLGSEREINPDVLGYIFEKFVNQKEKGAYYTKEDVTGYISQNTIIPWLLDRTRRECKVAFDPSQPGNAWTLLKETPEKYIYKSMKHGVIDAHNDVLPLPKPLVAGEHDYAQRGTWNQRATEPYALPTETWREYFHRRSRTLELREKLANGEIQEVDDLITWNIDIRQFAQDVVVNIGGIDLVRAFWKAVADITILDPTVGSGAFLFAAVRVVEPLYSGLLERMELAVAAEPGARTKDFVDILAEVAKHPNLDYFVMRRIILHNLYGVDIEEEAVEICKLRLFLLLAAKLEDGNPIEPLPDIDFNIRAGNTLVGYATEQEVVAATGAVQLALTSGDPIEEIRLEVVKADYALKHFKRIQVDDSVGRADLPNAKRQYQQVIDGLRTSMDRHLYKQLRLAIRFDDWRSRTQPFHWFAEFHDIVASRGGFDVIIGNPPYVRASKVRSKYDLTGFKTDKCPDIYAMVVERAVHLLESDGRSGMIVPLSLSFSGDFQELRALLVPERRLWVSAFDNIPAALFSGVSQRCSVIIQSPRRPQTFVTELMRWRSDKRPDLMASITYSEIASRAPEYKLPRIGSEVESQIFYAIEGVRPPEGIGETDSKFLVGFAPTARNYLSSYIDSPPSFTLDFQPIESSESSAWMPVTSELEQFALLALLASELGFWYWLTDGDGFHVTKGNVTPLAGVIATMQSDFKQALASLGYRLHRNRAEYWSFKKNAGRYVGSINYGDAHEISYRCSLVAAAGFGLPCTSVVQVIGDVYRRLSINEHAGEKGIPTIVHEKAHALVGGAPTVEPDWCMSLDAIDSLINDAQSYVDSAG